MQSTRRARWLPLAVAGLSVGGIASITITQLALGEGVDPSIGLGVAFAAFGVVGAVILARVPGNRLAWAFAMIGVIMPFGALQMLGRPLLEAGVSRDVVAVGQTLANASWSTGIFLLLVLVPAWFPDGRPLSPRWRWVTTLGAASWAATAAMALLQPEVEIMWDADADQWIPLRNPVGIEGVPLYEKGTLAGAAFLGLLLAAALAVGSLVVRYRRAGSLPRLQIRWLMSSFLFLIPVILIGSLVEGLDAETAAATASDGVFALAVLAIPVSAGIAVTRYRLYDLGKMVSRTVTYAVVVGTLAAVFAAGAVWLPSQLSSGSSSLAVAATTLVAFGLFDPLRRRVRRVVDRRFHRLSYDPERTLTELRARLRDQVEPAVLGESLRSASVVALNPERTSIWIRERW